jgi:RHS repeat-associated protein
VKLVFTYDYMSRRVRKEVFDWDDVGEEWESTASLDRKFVYDGWNVLLELDGLNSDAIVRKFTWGPDVAGLMGGAANGSFASAGGIGGLLAVSTGTTDEDYLYMYDANGNVGQLIAWANDYGSASGTAWHDDRIVAAYEYDAYGNVGVTSGAYNTDNPFRFSTKWFDVDSGLGNWGYRYYSPRLGRWASRDPLQELTAASLYRTLLNSPNNLLDLDGRIVIGLNGLRSAFDGFTGGREAIDRIGNEILGEINHWRSEYGLAPDPGGYIALEGGDGADRHRLRELMRSYAARTKLRASTMRCTACLAEGMVLFGYSDGATVIRREFRKGYARRSLGTSRISYLGFIDLVRTHWVGLEGVTPNVERGKTIDLPDADLALDGGTYFQNSGWWKGHVKVGPFDGYEVKDKDHFQMVKDDELRARLVREAVEAYKNHVKQQLALP